MSDSVLFVDDEINVLNSLKRLFVESDIRIMTALNAFEAMDILKNNIVSVIVSDNRMSEMTGIEFLQKAREISPESVRIIMTAYADLQTAIDAINKGAIYKFITKPWNDSDLKEIVFSAIDQYKIVSSLKKADEATLLSLAQTIELKDPYTRGHCDRVAQYAVEIAKAIGLPKDRQRHIQYGGWLHDCGKIGVPESVLNRKGPLSEEQMGIVKNHSAWGANVARLAQLPEAVLNIILYHHERYDGTGYPLGLKGADIPLEARIVSVADTYDALTSDRPYRDKFEHDKTIEFLNYSKGRLFDPEIVDVFINLFRGKGIS
ncbi:MAG: HD domain-containing protein [Nitrospirae bacterium]|nr:HD domain-containing protein [Nitrospirota bacterium]